MKRRSIQTVQYLAGYSRRRFSNLAAFVLPLLVGAALQSLFAQQPPGTPGIPRFEIPGSGLVWRAPAQPLRFFDATGRRAAVFGKQDGRLEAWLYPIKVLHGFHLEFQQEGMIEPVRGEAFLEQVITRPESTTLVYVHPLFTVRQIIWVPLDEPAIVMFFDVDSDKPLTLTVKFAPDFKPMWPASLGGQYSYWMEEDRAFGLTDATGRPTAMLGSPAVAGFTEHVGHALTEGEMLLQLRATPLETRAQFLPLVMALSMDSPDQAREIYHRVLARSLFEEQVAYHRGFLARTLQIETPDAALNRAFAWAKVALDAGWVCHPKYGCGLVAGYGPAKNSERPGFAWWFGGDALMASWALEDYGDLPGALQALRFLKARQRADGKMIHEMTQSVDLLDWFGKYGFAYYHADTTPMYLYSLAQYWNRTGDRNFLRDFWDSAKKAYAYCVSTADPGDGLMDNTKAGLAAVEVGALRGKVVKDIYLEGFWLAGLESMQRLAEAAGDSQLAADAKSRLAKAKDSLEGHWWNAQESDFAFGLAADGQRADMIGNWPSVMLALSSQISAGKAAAESLKLSSPELSTDWGVRSLSNKDPLYDPVSYNNGTVWPFMSTFVSLAQYRQGDTLAGFSTWSDTARLTGIQSPGYMPEHMNGDRYLPGERSVPHQLFSSVGVVVPAVRGLLGLQTSVASDARGGDQILVSFHPHPPANWPFLRFSGYLAGNGHLSGEVRQEPGRTAVQLQNDAAQPVSIALAAPVPLLARVRRVSMNGKSVKFRPQQSGDSSSVRIEFALQGKTEIMVDYDGGVGIVPPVAEPQPGERTSSLKILRVAVLDGNNLELTLAGLGGRSYPLELVTPLPNLTAGGIPITKTETGYRLEIPFQGSGYVQQVIRLRF